MTRETDSVAESKRSHAHYAAQWAKVLAQIVTKSLGKQCSNAYLRQPSVFIKQKAKNEHNANNVQYWRAVCRQI